MECSNTQCYLNTVRKSLFEFHSLSLLVAMVVVVVLVQFSSGCFLFKLFFLLLQESRPNALTRLVTNTAHLRIAQIYMWFPAVTAWR